VCVLEVLVAGGTLPLLQDGSPSFAILLFPDCKDTIFIVAELKAQDLKPATRYNRLQPCL